MDKILLRFLTKWYEQYKCKITISECKSDLYFWFDIKFKQDYFISSPSMFIINTVNFENKSIDIGIKKEDVSKLNIES
jgi:hypothetical protein